jgi:hypothetical protein
LRTLFKLAILLLAAHALFRFVPPYWNHHQFEQDLKTVSEQWGDPQDEEVMQHVLATAEKHSVPITREHVTITRAREHILINVAYALPIEWVPTVKKPWDFTTKIDVWKFGGGSKPRR